MKLLPIISLVGLAVFLSPQPSPSQPQASSPPKISSAHGSVTGPIQSGATMLASAQTKQSPIALKTPSKHVMASLERSRSSLQTGSWRRTSLLLRCDQSPVMLTNNSYRVISHWTSSSVPQQCTHRRTAFGLCVLVLISLLRPNAWQRSCADSLSLDPLNSRRDRPQERCA